MMAAPSCLAPGRHTVIACAEAAPSWPAKAGHPRLGVPARIEVVDGPPARAMTAAHRS